MACAMEEVPPPWQAEGRGVSVGSPPWQSWRQGSLVSVAAAIGGAPLRWAVLGAATLAQVGMFAAEQFEDSYLLAGMARVGLMPPLLAHRNRRCGSPHRSLGAVALANVLVGFGGFAAVLSITNVFQALCLLLLLATALRRRCQSHRRHAPTHTWRRWSDACQGDRANASRRPADLGMVNARSRRSLGTGGIGSTGDGDLAAAAASAPLAPSAAARVAAPSPPRFEIPLGLVCFGFLLLAPAAVTTAMLVTLLRDDALTLTVTVAVIAVGLVCQLRPVRVRCGCDSSAAASAAAAPLSTACLD